MIQYFDSRQRLVMPRSGLPVLFFAGWAFGVHVVRASIDEISP